MALNPSGQLYWGEARTDFLILSFDLHMHACPYSYMYHTHMYTKQNKMYSGQTAHQSHSC